MTYDSDGPGIVIVRDSFALASLTTMAEGMFGDMVKAVVDLERAVMALGGAMHADEEAELLADGSTQTDLWGINLYPANFGAAEFIEFDSMINLRPRQNRTRGVDDPVTRAAIVVVVDRLVRD
jgi:Protein of unknown function (DUF5674)